MLKLGSQNRCTPYKRPIIIWILKHQCRECGPLNCFPIRLRVTKKVFKLWNNLLVLVGFGNQTCKKRRNRQGFVLHFLWLDFLLLSIERLGVGVWLINNEKLLKLIDLFHTYIPIIKLIEQYYFNLNLTQTYSRSIVQLSQAQ